MDTPDIGLGVLKFVQYRHNEHFNTLAGKVGTAICYEYTPLSKPHLTDGLPNNAVIISIASPRDSELHPKKSIDLFYIDLEEDGAAIVANQWREKCKKIVILKDNNFVEI